jgi:type IV pilus assembly protein PilA
MLSIRQRLARDESGFTLIELLVVLIIIGVLLAIAIPSYLGFQKKAQQTAAASDVRQAIPDAVAYYSDHNSYAGLATGGVAALQQYDSGMQAYVAASGSTPETPGIVTVKGGATTFCISAEDAGNYAHVVGPGGTVVSNESTDYCASTYTAS